MAVLKRTAQSKDADSSFRFIMRRLCTMLPLPAMSTPSSRKGERRLAIS